MEGNVESEVVTTYPLNTTATSQRFLQPKYHTLQTITLDGFDSVEPGEVESVRDWLLSLPAGFVKDAYYGLGLNYELRFIINAIEKVDGVTDLFVRRGRVPMQAIVDRASYIIKASDFDRVRRSIDRAHRKALAIAADEKRAFVHNTLLTSLDPARFPETHRPYRKDAVLEAIGKTLQRDLVLSPGDRQAVMAAAGATARNAQRSESGALLKLSREIELVTLEDLLDRLRAMIGRSQTEAAWQAFFTDNPFILRLAFGPPIMVIAGQVAVGGRKLSGKGDKVTDFVVKAAASGNLSLVEIKTPAAPLLEGRPYRGELYAPSRELSGAVNQVLDQRYQLQRSISGLKDASGVWDIESYAIQGLVIAGRIPEERPQLKSLELFRNGLKSITVLTFDELIIKLEYLLDVFRAAQAEAD